MMGFVRKIAEASPFGAAGLLKNINKKPTPSLASSATAISSDGTTTPSLISNPTIY